MSKVIQHYQDLLIEKQFENDISNIPIRRIFYEPIPKGSEDKSISTFLSTSIMRAVLLGEEYPNSLYQVILLRIQAERDINYYQASILKAYLVRKARRLNNKLITEVLTLSLNENTNNKAYLLGRLFAVLEKAQKESNPNINTTIRDKYFSSACATPAAVFPTLFALAQYHIAKFDYGYYYDNMIADIMDKLDIDNEPFPKNLTLDEQGIFYLGYYHQRNSLYKSKGKDNKQNNEENKE